MDGGDASVRAKSKPPRALRRGKAAWALLALVAAGGCSPTLPSPPGHTLHLTTPASAGKGTTLVRGSIGAGGEVFGPSIVSGEIGARHGVTESLDVGLSASAVGLVGDDELATRHHAGIYSLRAFAHHELVPRVLSVHLGVAGGGSAGGGFLSPDAGFTLGYENPHAVPYAFGTFYVSAPISENSLDMRETGATLGDLRAPYLSYGPRLGGGVRVPIGPSRAPVGSLLFEVGGTWLFGDDPADDRARGVRRAFMSLGIGYRARFGGGPAPR